MLCKGHSYKQLMENQTSNGRRLRTPLEWGWGAKNLTVSTTDMTNSNMYKTKKKTDPIKEVVPTSSWNVGTLKGKCLKICETLERKLYRCAVYKRIVSKEAVQEVLEMVTTNLSFSGKETQKAQMVLQ